LIGEYEKSLQFIDKAIQFDSKYGCAYRFKGCFQLAHNHADQAAISFYQANTLDRDMPSFLGLIQSNLALGILFVIFLSYHLLIINNNFNLIFLFYRQIT
jgi:hypothetical protein